MPLLAYFVVVGSLLMGLLYVAEAQLGPPTSLSISSNFHGLPQPWKSAAVPILTVRDAPAPDITKAPDMTKTALVQPAVSDIAVPKTAKMARDRKAKRTHKSARHSASRNLYAESGVVLGKSHRVW
jgi:hypothetical protein